MQMRGGGLLALSILALGACNRASDAPNSTVQSDAASDKLLRDSADGDDWPAYGRSYGEQHFSPLEEINQGNVARLGLAWSMDLPPGNAATQPLEVGGTLYFATGMSIVHAVDAATGKLLWQFDPKITEHAGREMRTSWGIRGIGWWNGKVYTGTVDGRLIAIDAKTGKQVWSVRTTEKGSGAFITGAPRAFAGRIVIGQGGGDTTNNRGYATAYDAETGKQLWRFFIVPGDPKKGFENDAMAMAAKTWTGEWWKWGGGGQPWNGFTFDPDTDTLLIGTGNGFPHNARARSPAGGDNLFLCSIVAVDAKTGQYKWHYQYNPGETWDYNSTMDMQLADLSISGQPRKVVLHAPKNGFLYVLDRTDGKLISAGKIARVTWASHIDLKTGRPVENPAARYPKGAPFEVWPTTAGAHSWMPMAYSPKAKLVYIPKIEQGGVFSDSVEDLKGWKNGDFGPGRRTTPPKDPLHGTTALLAWDPVTQTQKWKVDTVGGWNGGVLATAGNLVFQGQLNGKFSAYAGDSGKELWRFAAQAGILGAPISYRVGGKQFVTVLVGVGTSAAYDPKTHGGIVFDYRSQKRRVLTFMLDGKASLPPAPAPFGLKAVADADYRADPALATKGWLLYARNCQACHGPDAISGGAAPDLRGSAVAQSAEAFDSIVRKGGLVAAGMPAFGEKNDEEVAAMRQYLRSRSADLRAGR